MDFLSEYGLFSAKLITVLVLLIGVSIFIVFIIQRSRASHEERLEVKYLNDRYETMALTLKSAILPRRAFKQALKEFKAKKKQGQKLPAQPAFKKRVFVLRFHGDPRALAVSALREEITAALMLATERDEVVVLLESPGGLVHSYGLAASQLQRIKDRGIPLTVCVDKVAASGGYMMACVADQIIAAPFAVVGSIGVVGQLPNFNRMLKNHDIEFELITAGEYKRTLTLFGENTDKGRAKFRDDIEETHALFKAFVRDHRGTVDIDKVSTGEHWYGVQALALKLVDAIRTSDDYLKEAANKADLYELTYLRKKGLRDRLLTPAAQGLAEWRDHRFLV